MKPILTFLIITLTLGTASAQFTKLFDFAGATNGSYPKGSLISDGTFLYGMTYTGGASNVGTLFKIMPDGTGYVKLLDLASAGIGAPWGSLISDGTFLYGTTNSGGTNGTGTLFKIMTNGTGYAKLLDFDITNGLNPRGSLISDGTFLYGMTAFGGTNDLGILFKIKPDGTGYEKLLNFDGATNGGRPQGSLISDGTFLYGMTVLGGTNDLGTVFKIMPNGTGYQKLIDFAGVINGSNPYGSLISDGTFLYGMTTFGGTNNIGTIFKIMPDGTGFVKLSDFAGATNGSTPYGSFIYDGSFLYGMTHYGGANDFGTLFKIMPNGSGYVKLVDLADDSNGMNPQGSLFSDGTFLYGMTRLGGTNSMGTLFKYQLSAFSGISDHKNTIALSAFPNPVKDILTIRKPEGVSAERVIITDLMGKKVSEQTSNLTQIDVSQLPPGMYLLQITFEGKKSVSKFIKQ